MLPKCQGFPKALTILVGGQLTHLLIGGGTPINESQVKGGTLVRPAGRMYFSPAPYAYTNTVQYSMVYVYYEIELGRLYRLYSRLYAAYIQ